MAFEAIAQMLCSPMRAGDTQRMALCDLEMKEKGEVSYWEEIPVYGPKQASRVDSFNDYLSCCNKLENEI